MFLRATLALVIGTAMMLTIFWDVLAQVVAQIDPHATVETVWPTSVAGWIGISLSTITFLAIVWHAVKKPGEVAAKAVEDRLVVKLDKITDAMTVLRSESERGLAEFKGGLEQERRECADRLDEIRKDFKERDGRLNTMENNWTQSREDRRHLTQGVADLKESISRWREEDRARDDRMLEAMVRLKGGRND